MIASWTPQLLPPQFRMIATAAVIIATLAAAGYAGWTVRAWRCDSQTAAISRQLIKFQSENDKLSKSSVTQNAAISQWKQRAEDVQKNAADALKQARDISASKQKEIASLKRRIAAGGASCSVAISEIKGEL